MIGNAIALTYLVAAVLFILGLKRLSSPATARSGNLLASVGMLLAIVATLLYTEILTFRWILVGIAIGGGAGGTLARTVKMTAMPQMVALLNGFGGGASVLIASAEYLRPLAGGPANAPDVTVSIMLSVVIGAVTFSGSMIAFAKLQELMSGRAITYMLQRTGNLLLFVVIAGLAAYLAASPPAPGSFLTLGLLALLLGVLVVIPIGGADMPVVISLLNSYSGLAAAMTGFVLHNNALIISGALVGASGMILTQIMCRAMNRSLANVLFGTFGAAAAGPAGGGDPAADGRVVRDVSPEDAAILLSYARTVVVVPGYGLAVAQAQHNVRELGDLLEDRGVQVKYGIHPVAGRMPGHMNVLLAEAHVPYPQLHEMERINPELPRTDVVVVIGANDVVNPDAREKTDSPLYGMPILNVDEATTVIVMKRSLNPGFAGIDNPLFYRENTRMLFGDARESLTRLVQEVKNMVTA